MGTSAPQPELVERDHDLARLAEGLAAAREGRGSLVAIEGPPGIKTRLIDRLRGDAAGAGVTVLSARGGELESGFAFGVGASYSSRGSLRRAPRSAPSC